MVTAARRHVGIWCIVLTVGIVGCVPRQGWHRPVFTGGNCGLMTPVASAVFEAPAQEVSSALRLVFQNAGWEPLQDNSDHLTRLYRRTLTEPTEGLPGLYYQYFLVIVTPVKETLSKVSFVLSEFEPARDAGTSFALVAPGDFIDNYDELVQNVKELLNETSLDE